jgi:hypothetical protein
MYFTKSDISDDGRDISEYMCSCHRFPHFIHSTCWKSSLVPSELASSYCPMCLHERFEELFPVRNNNKSHIIHQLGYLLSKFYLPEDLIVLHSLIELEAGLTEKEEQTEKEEEKQQQERDSKDWKVVNKTKSKLSKKKGKSMKP